jgi:hypothetical protein
MRRIAPAVLVIAALMVLPPVIAAGKRSSCGRRQGHTLVQSDTARAYTLDGDVFACAIPAGVAYRLGSASVCVGSSRAGPVAIAGRLVAYGLERCGVDTGSTIVVVRRLTNGKRLHSDPATTRPVGPESYQTVDSLVVKRDGSDAWIAVANSLGTHGTGTEVHAHDTNGFALLDSGDGVNPSSLRLDGSQLTWRHGARKRSATLS